MATKKSTTADAGPAFYALTLLKGWTSPDGLHQFGAGPQTIAADVVADIPADIVVDKTPAEG